MTVLAIAAAEQFQEPNVPAPQIVIEMPPLKTLRSVVDRLKGVHKSITVEASKRGTLALRIDTHPLTLQTLFAHLRFRDDLVDDGNEEDEDEEDESMGDSEATAASRKRRRGSRQDRASSNVTVEAKVLGKAILMDNGSVDCVLCCTLVGFTCVNVVIQRTNSTLHCRYLGEPRARTTCNPFGWLWVVHVLSAGLGARRVTPTPLHKKQRNSATSKHIGHGTSGID